MHTCIIHTYILTYIPAHINTCMLAYLNTIVLTYLYTYHFNTYINTYIQVRVLNTYKYTCTCVHEYPTYLRLIQRRPARPEPRSRGNTLVAESR